MMKIFTLLALLMSIGESAFSVPEIWAEPVPYFEVERSFIAPVTAKGSGHRGLDFVVDDDEPILAPVGGVVTFAGIVVDRSVVTFRTNAGLLVSFEQVCSAVSTGQHVSGSQPVGIRCTTHDTFSEHCQKCVHMSVRSEFGYLNPELFLGTLEPSVLKL